MQKREWHIGIIPNYVQKVQRVRKSSPVVPSCVGFSTRVHRNTILHAHVVQLVAFLLPRIVPVLRNDLEPLRPMLRDRPLENLLRSRTTRVGTTEVHEPTRVFRHHLRLVLVLLFNRHLCLGTPGEVVVNRKEDTHIDSAFIHGGYRMCPFRIREPEALFCECNIKAYQGDGQEVMALAQHVKQMG